MMRIENKNGKSYLVVKEDASLNDYKVILNFVTNELQVKNVKEVNDFDSYYHCFIYKGYNVVLTYNVSLGIKLFLFDDVEIDIQNELLHEFTICLQKVI